MVLPNEYLSIFEYFQADNSNISIKNVKGKIDDHLVQS